jgi:transcriptional regulator with XRE-family HTH domain
MYDRYCTLRDLKGLTDAEISRICVFSKSTLSDWKSGKATPKTDKLILIAKALGTTVEYLMTGEKPEIPGFEPEHLELIELYSKLNKEQKSAILNMMRSFALSD